MSWLDALDILTAIVALALLIGGAIWLGLYGIRRRLDAIRHQLKFETDLSQEIANSLEELKVIAEHVEIGGRKRK